MNILNRGSSVTWKQLKTTYNLKSPRAMVEGVLRLSVNWNALDKNKDTAREKLEQAFELLALETFLEEEKEEEKKIPYVCVLNALSDYYVTAKEGT